MLREICPEIGFSIHEINRLLKGDIYGIVRRFLEPMYESGELEDYAPGTNSLSASRNSSIRQDCPVRRMIA